MANACHYVVSIPIVTVVAVGFHLCGVNNIETMHADPIMLQLYSLQTMYLFSVQHHTV